MEHEYSGLADPPTELPIVPVFPVRAAFPACEYLMKWIVEYSLLLRIVLILHCKKWRERWACLRQLLSIGFNLLQKDGVIVGHYYLIDVKVFRELPMGLLIKSKVLGESERGALRNFCRVHPRIAWITFFLGGYSAEIFVRVTNYEEAKDLTHEIFLQSSQM